MMTQTNPFAAFQKFAAFKAPAAFDAEAVSAFYRKNFETLVQVNAVLTEGARIAANRSAEILKDTAAEAPVALRSVFEGKNPNDFVANQADFVKRGFERATANARELADIVTKVQSEALDIVTKRLAAGLDEVAGSAKSAKKVVAAA
jgi:phasin family protein